MATLRKYQQQDIVLEPNLPTYPSLKEFIYDPKGLALGNYEHDFRQQQVFSQVSGLYTKQLISKSQAHP